MGLYFGVVFSRRQTGRQQQLLASWPPSSDSYSKNKQQHSWGDANFVKVVKSTSQPSLQVWKAYVISKLYLFEFDRRLWCDQYEKNLFSLKQQHAFGSAPYYNQTTPLIQTLESWESYYKQAQTTVIQAHIISSVRCVIFALYG